MSRTSFKGKVFDQFRLSDQLGFVRSSMAMSILRVLLRHKELNEGDLAQRIGSRMFRPEWSEIIGWLENQGFVKFTPTGRAQSRTVGVTEKALDWLLEEGVEAEPDPVPEAPQEPEEVIHPTKEELCPGVFTKE